MSQNAARYATPQILLHSLMAVLIIGLYIVGLSVDAFEKPVRPTIVNLHALGGLLLLLLLVPRLLLKLIVPAPNFPPSMGPAFIRAARLGHAALYVVMVVVPLLGISTFLYRGQPLNLFFFQIEPLFPANRDLSHAIVEYHGLAANVLIALVVGHVLISLYHQFVLKDNLLDRMNPRAR
jgi:cytochrome b561